MPTDNLTQTLKYAAAGAVAAGVTIGVMNRSKKNTSNKIHVKTTLEDLEK
jgi:hypothetical protein